MFANSFGAIESVVFDPQQMMAQVNFVDARCAQETMVASEGNSVYLGNGVARIGWGTSPPEDPVLLQHVAAGATRNLFLSNFGTATADELFHLVSPHSQVVDVVMKDKYAFVNTTSVAGAIYAKTNLENHYVGGQMLQVRYGKEPKEPHDFGKLPNKYTTPHKPVQPQGGQPNEPTHPTKVLYVAGYQPHQSESDLRNLFEQMNCAPVNITRNEKGLMSPLEAMMVLPSRKMYM